MSFEEEAALVVSLPMGQSARLDRRKRLSLLFYANGALSLKRRWTCEQGVLWTGAECGKRPLQPPSARGEDSKVRRACPSTRTRTAHTHPQRRKPPPPSRPAAGALSAVLTQAPPRPDQAPPGQQGAQPSDGAVPTHSRRLCDEPPRGRNTLFPEPTLPPQSYGSRTQPSGPSAQSQGPGARASALREPGRFQHLASCSSR